MNKPAVVITGCGGMLGEGVYDAFKGAWDVRASDIDQNAPWLEYLDVRDPVAVEQYLSEIKPDAIVHLAALTDMEYCERNSEDAYATNTHAVEYMARYAEANDIPLVYISTAGIFDGKKEGYLESDTPNPLSVYGRSKYEGEIAARKVPKSIVVRAGWMMGGGPTKDKKFVNKMIRQLRAGAKELFVVNDKFGTPCYTYDLAQSLKYLLENGAWGVYHGACDGGASRADTARFLLECLGVADTVSVKEVSSDFFKDNYFAPRPFSERLINTELKRIAPQLTRDWRECLAEYVEKFEWEVSAT